MIRYRAWITIFVLLLLMLIPSVNAQQPGNPIPIQYGQTLNGQLGSAQDYHFFSFNGTAGDQITITVNSAVDTFVQLGDVNTNVLAENDDSVPNSDLNPRLDFTLATTGTYLIGVGGYSAGTYSLTLQSANAQNQSSGGSIPIQYGATVTGQATSLESPVFYSFNGNAGDNISILLESTQIDTYLQLGDASANLLAEHDDIDV
ncbi:MAG TPA: PPC domain-containing protein, partial [Aggregatilineales bacterium]|nr:PPC domain-containing protein [Aggregatilineales bacterium]